MKKVSVQGHDEQGRTILETLAVVAIMGLITYAGVQGYKVAMNSYRSAATLDQAVKLAMDIASKRRIGLPINLSAMDANRGPYQFTFREGEESHMFVLTAHDVPAAVRDRLVGTTSNLAQMAVSGENVDFTFKNNLSPWYREVDSSSDGNLGDTSSGSNTGSDTTPSTDTPPESGSAGGSGASDLDVGSCPDGNVYLSYMDDPCGTVTPMTGDCTKNSDCTGEKCTADQCYCNLTGAWQDGCAVITGGTCEALDDGASITYEYDGQTKELLLGGQMMNWWSAENWCKAHQRNLVKLSTLGGKTNGSTASCPGDFYDEYSTDLTSRRGWTADSYNSCNVFYVGLTPGNAYSYHRRSWDYNYALCE